MLAALPQVYDVSDASVLPCAFAEVCVLQHLVGWPGSVQLLDYGREGDEVRFSIPAGWP